MTFFDLTVALAISCALFSLIWITPESVRLHTTEWQCTKTEIIAGKAECVTYERTKK